MIYITTLQKRKPREITWDDVIEDKIIFNELANDTSRKTATITRRFEETPKEFLRKISVPAMIDWLKKFNQDNEELFKANRNSLYYSFKIPKTTGGFRNIDAPHDPLQKQLRRLAEFMYDDCGVKYHTSCFSYITGRSIMDCLQRHQRFESKWYLKTDISGFFPHTTLEFVMRMAEMVFPLSEICKDPEGRKELKKAISLGFKDGGLPQGSSLSPAVTCWMYIPIDFELFNFFSKRDMVYTRYADDMIVSAKQNFPINMAIGEIKHVLHEFNAPHYLNEEKTRYGSNHGSGDNWNLGLMVNKDNNITIGWRKKQYFKSALCSFILDTKNKKYWQIEDVYHLRGLLSYYTMVEPEYFKDLIKRQNEKWQVNVKNMFKAYFNGEMA